MKVANSALVVLLGVLGGCQFSTSGLPSSLEGEPSSGAEASSSGSPAPATEPSAPTAQSIAPASTTSNEPASNESSASTSSDATAQAPSEPAEAAPAHQTRTLTLAPDFSMRVVGVQGAGGENFYHEDGCVSWSSYEPDAIVTVSGRISMHISGASGSDTRLIVTGPGGDRCAAGVGAESAAVIAGEFEPGEYRVWMASMNRFSTVRGHITFAED